MENRVCEHNLVARRSKCAVCVSVCVCVRECDKNCGCGMSSVRVNLLVCV